MSRTAAAYLNTPIAQLEGLDAVLAVFERNTRAQIDNALRFIEPTPEILDHIELLKLAAEEVVSSHGQGLRHEAAKDDFRSLAVQLRAAIVALPCSRAALKQREIASLGV